MPVSQGLVPQSSPRQAGMESGHGTGVLPTARVLAPDSLGKGAVPAWQSLGPDCSGKVGKSSFPADLSGKLCLNTGHLHAPQDAHVACQEIW